MNGVARWTRLLHALTLGGTRRVLRADPAGPRPGRAVGVPRCTILGGQPDSGKSFAIAGSPESRSVDSDPEGRFR